MATTWTISEPQRLDLDQNVSALDVNLIAGRLSVVGTDGPVHVEINEVGATGLTVELDAGGRLAVGHEWPKTWPGFLKPLWWMLYRGRRFAADITVAVPPETRTVLRMASGTVVASTIYADLDVECTSGRTCLLGIDGRIRARVVSGPIEALGCAGDVSLETVSGEITLADAFAQRVTAKTISGALTADLDNPPHNSVIALETVSGEITIRVREDSDLTVRLTTAHARVTSAFPDLSVEGKWGTSVRGVLGKGTGQLNASAIGGSISLLRRPVDESFGDAA